MKYSDAQRLEKICVTTRKLLSYLQSNKITRELILADETIRWTITTPLYNIGEQAYWLTDTFKEQFSMIPWSKISGLRHRLVHDYDNTNWKLICTILFEVLPPFLNDAEEILAQIKKE